MIKTLHGYLGRDLAKVTGLALVAFTLLMTIFAIIEPLRKEGLGPEQALWLVAFTLPIMTSLTLPIAALFAATIVYGRFSQDNELMASRASGISTLSLLKPALLLGVIVTIVSLILSSFVTPQMARLVETSVKSNVREIVYRRLRSAPYVDYGNLVIHADAVDEANDAIYGLVVAQTKPKDDVVIVAAPKALVQFTERDGISYVTFYLKNVAMARTSDYGIAEAGSHPPITQQIPTLAKEDPSWYDWRDLLKTLENPMENTQTRRYFREKIVRQICGDMLDRRIAAAVADGQSYDELQDAQYSYRIRAGQAVAGEDGVLKLRGAERDGTYQPVAVTILREGTPFQLVTANVGEIETAPSLVSQDWFVTVKLKDEVTVTPLGEHRSIPQRRVEWVVGQLAVPKDVADKANAIPLLDIIRNPESITSDPGILDKISYSKTVTIQRLINRVKAEMHMRAAYSLSCFLMVAMGAALGLIFRGGQIVSAFAITVVPASLVIVMMLMGKQMVRNPAVSAYYGLMTIWAGIAILAAADVVIYLFLRRR